MDTTATHEPRVHVGTGGRTPPLWLTALLAAVLVAATVFGAARGRRLPRDARPGIPRRHAARAGPAHPAGRSRPGRSGGPGAAGVPARPHPLVGHRALRPLHLPDVRPRPRTTTRSCCTSLRSASARTCCSTGSCGSTSAPCRASGHGCPGRGPGGSSSTGGLFALLWLVQNLTAIPGRVPMDCSSTTSRAPSTSSISPSCCPW